MKKYENFAANLKALCRADKEDLSNDFIVSGIIDKFFLQFELSWKLFKELMKYEGMAIANTGSPRELIKAAYGIWDFIEEDVWLGMLRARNDLAHIYDGNKANEMLNDILTKYIPAFKKVDNALQGKYGDLLKQT